MRLRRGTGASGSQGGFTLLEIMIVISIVSMLAAFSIPRMLDAQKTAQRSKALAILRQLFDAQTNYHRKFGEYAPNIGALVAANYLTSPFKGNTSQWQVNGYYEFTTLIPSPSTSGDGGPKPPPPSTEVNKTLRFRIGCQPTGTNTADRAKRGDESFAMLENGQIYVHKATGCSLNHILAYLTGYADSRFGNTADLTPALGSQ